MSTYCIARKITTVRPKLYGTSLASLHEVKQKGHNIAVNLNLLNLIYSSFYFKACVIYSALSLKNIILVRWIWVWLWLRFSLVLIVSRPHFYSFACCLSCSLTDVVAYIQVYTYTLIRFTFFLIRGRAASLLLLLFVSSCVASTCNSWQSVHCAMILGD